MKKIIIFAVIIIGVIALTGYLFLWSTGEVSNVTSSPSPTVSSSPSVSPTAATSPTVSPTKSPTPTAVSTVKTFTVIGKPFSFTPSVINVNKGDTVKIIFQNTGGTHDWRLDEFNAQTNILQNGQEQTIQFIADKKGTFEYYCSIGTHRQMGMKGNLIVK